jgi:acetylglutamate kinase
MRTFDEHELSDIATTITVAVRRLTEASEQLNEQGAEVIGLSTLDGTLSDLTALRDDLLELVSEARSINEAEMQGMFEDYNREEADRA